MKAAAAAALLPSFLPSFPLAGVYPFVIFPSQFYFEATFFFFFLLLRPAATAHRESTVITVQSCYLSFIRRALFGKCASARFTRLAFIRPQVGV